MLALLLLGALGGAAVMSVVDGDDTTDTAPSPEGDTGLATDPALAGEHTLETDPIPAAEPDPIPEPEPTPEIDPIPTAEPDPSPDPEPEPAPEPVPVVVSGEEILFDRTDTLLGTDGNDTLPAGQPFDQSPMLIDLQGGDDIAIADWDGFTTILGGEGNDTLYGDDSFYIYGEEGDDHITADYISDRSAYWGSDTAAYDGGEGNDTIEVEAVIGHDSPAFGSASLFGGEGEDSFHITLHAEGSTGHWGSTAEHSTRLLTVRDFDPEEDTLAIELDTSASPEGQTIDLTFAQEESDGTYSTTLTFNLSETATSNAAVASLTIQSDVAITADDIVLLGTCL